MHHLNKSSTAANCAENASSSLNSAFQTCTDTSDAVELFGPQKLFLKPVARLNISVQLPQLKLPGKTISNWEVMEKLKSMVKPIQFTVLKVSKSTLEFIRFEGEIENKANLNGVVSQLDGRTIKLSGFSELLKIRAAEAKVAFPTRHTWDSYFRDAKNMNEMKPGERPDTIHLSNLPSRWFSSKHDNTRSSDKPSEYIFRKVFEQFGEVRCVDIPILDPYRSQMKAHISGLKTFTFGQELAFEGYVQFQEYVCFVKAMDALRGMKLLHKEGDKAYTASIKVDFDRTKHLSDASIRRRRTERERLMARERELEERERRARELAEKEAENQRKQLEEEELLKLKLAEERKKRKAERHQARQLRRLKREEAQKMNYKIAVEERKLLIAQRKLESIRLLDELFERVKIVYLKEKASKERERTPKKEDVQKDDMERKERELRAKLIKKFKSMQESQLKGQQERLRRTLEGKNKIKSVLASSVKGAESDASTISSSSEDCGESDHKNEKSSSGNKNNKTDSDPASSWFAAMGIPPIPGLPAVEYHTGYMGPNIPTMPFAFNPQASSRYPYSQSDFYENRRRWSRYARSHGYHLMQNYYYGATDDYYKYFSKLAGNKEQDGSRSRSRSRPRSTSRSRRRTRSCSRSRSKSRKTSKETRRRDSRNRSRRTKSRSRSRSRSRSKKIYRPRSRDSRSSPAKLKDARLTGKSGRSARRSRSRSSGNRRSRSGGLSRSSRASRSPVHSLSKSVKDKRGRSHIRSLSKDLSISPSPKIHGKDHKSESIKKNGARVDETDTKSKRKKRK